MPELFRDIDDLGFGPSKKVPKGPGKFITGCPERDEPDQEEKPEPLVRLLSARWKPGPRGFQYNEQCFLEVRAQYLKKTVRSRVRGKLYGIYNGIEEDLLQEVEGFIQKDGTAMLEIKKLWFINDDHYSAWKKDKTTPAKYLIKEISHSRGENVINGPELEMPVENKITVHFLEVPDILFHHNSAVACLDTEGELVGALSTALVYAHENSQKEMILYGHTDSSGEDEYNKDLSEQRCTAIKALFDDKKDVFVDVCAQKGKTEDYQKILSTLASQYGYDCDPGKIDNKDGPKTQAALKQFQSGYNRQFEPRISEDGEIGPQTWGAFFTVTRHYIWKAASKKLGDKAPVIAYGEGGKGIYPCGETFARDAHTKQGRRSQKDRRVEIVFKNKEDVISDTPYSGPVIMEPITIVSNLQSPAPRVRIDTLDKWFIPGPQDKGGEVCALKYSLGKAPNATGRMQFDVYASNYCDAQMKDDFSVTFSELADKVPIYSQHLSSEKAEAGKQFEITDWNGKSTASQGALKPRDGAERYINVAFSPYTVHFRWLADDADKDARIDLRDFWPRWSDGGASVIEESLEIKWGIVATDKFKAGRVVIVDKTDKEVYSRDLAESEVAQGEHEFAWDGVLASGEALSEDNMPYRVQIQAWSDDSVESGVSAAAMHTEVRLFVHPETGKHPDEPWKDGNSLRFGLAPYVIKEPDEAAEQRWYQWKLAEGGFHPGPVDGKFLRMSRRALREFQRSYPANETAPFRRLNPSGDRDDETKEALKRLPSDARALFGDPDSERRDLNADTAVVRLNDKDKEIIVWVDDRQYYTGRFDTPNVIPADDSVYLDDYGGWFDAGDTKVNLESESIARPWIPLYSQVGLLKRGDELDAIEGTFNEAAQNAIGALNVEWSFDDASEDLSVIKSADKNYDTSLTRSKKWVETVVDRYKATDGGKEFTNCRSDFGGIRPANAADYYRAPFGLGELSLRPWNTVDDAAHRVVSVVMHDEVGQNENLLDERSVGRSGIYLRLSRIGGDGYRFYSGISFRESANALKNNPILGRRYPSAPKASTVQMRIWRKTSYRNYVRWAPAADDHWNAHSVRNAELYSPAYCHFVHEGGTPNSFTPTDLMTADEFSNIVRGAVTEPPYRNYAPHFDNQHVWPYMNQPHLGIPRSELNDSLDEYIRSIVSPIGRFIWDPISEELLHFTLRNIEGKHGLLKGHMVAEFLSTPQIMFTEYECNNCGSTMIEVTNNCTPADLLQNSACLTTGCNGTMQASLNWTMDGLGFSALGYGLGASWNFVGDSATLWTHEIGHNKYLEHCQSQPGSTDSPGGFNNAQHDSVMNPDP
ncbi:MAG: peptidoglycan-binding protein, partial [Chitinispirillaceae bacterium]